MYDTIVDIATKTEYEVKADKDGENYQPCPVCKYDRKPKNQNKPCFSYNATKGVGNCLNCGRHFVKKNEDYKNYVRPLWENKTTLPDKVVEWFNKRNISQETLTAMRVTHAVEFMPQVLAERNVICFNYFREGQLVNVKYRDGEKNFKLVKNAEKIFYNLDGLALQKECYIVEGEIDCLTMVQAGHGNTVSVPNGATKAKNNLDYLDRCWPYFEGMEKVFILTDNDEPGENLAQELARRIGVEKCYRVFIPFKDVNEQLCTLGKVDVSEVKPFPIRGIYSVEDHWQDFLNLIANGYPKGWQPRAPLGQFLSFFPGYTTIITGIPGHGKSEILDQMLVQLCIDYGLRGSFFTPENWPSEMHILKLVNKLLGKSAFKCSPQELAIAKNFITEKIYWIYPEEGYDLESVLEKTRQAVLRHGINWYVIDPWNKLEHQDDSTHYISKCLDLIANFNKKNGVHGFIVAHPVKMKFNYDEDRYEIPGLYDISGSANFYNKADIGLTMYKHKEPNKNTLYVQKVRFSFWGRTGEVAFNWNPDNGRYSEQIVDYSNWIQRTDNAPPIDFTEPTDKFDDLPF